MVKKLTSSLSAFTLCSLLAAGCSSIEEFPDVPCNAGQCDQIPAAERLLQSLSVIETIEDFNQPKDFKNIRLEAVTNGDSTQLTGKAFCNDLEIPYNFSSVGNHAFESDNVMLENCAQDDTSTFYLEISDVALNTKEIYELNIETYDFIGHAPLYLGTEVLYKD